MCASPGYKVQLHQEPSWLQWSLSSALTSSLKIFAQNVFYKSCGRQLITVAWWWLRLRENKWGPVFQVLLPEAGVRSHLKMVAIPEQPLKRKVNPVQCCLGCRRRKTEAVRSHWGVVKSQWHGDMQTMRANHDCKHLVPMYKCTNCTLQSWTPMANQFLSIIF